MNSSEVFQKCMAVFEDTNKIFEDSSVRSNEIAKERLKLEDTYGFAAKCGAVAEIVITAMLFLGIRAVGSIPTLLLGIYIFSLFILTVHVCIYCFKKYRLDKRTLAEMELVKETAIKSKRVYYLCLLANANNMLMLSLRYKGTDEWKEDDQEALEKEAVKTHNIIMKELNNYDLKFNENN